MQTKTSQENPFDYLKATDFSDEEIYEYWVDLVGDVKLRDFLNPKSTTATMLLGGKGSGKTHLMRYHSSQVQRLRGTGNLYDAARNDGYLGIYVRADALNVRRFEDKGQAPEEWAAVFEYYFELRLAINLLKSATILLDDAGITNHAAGFHETISELFHNRLTTKIHDPKELLGYITQLRKDVDKVVANVATRRSTLTEIDIDITPGSLVFGIPAALASLYQEFSNTTFVYMIDELENFSESQQMFVNSLIRYRKGPVSIKVGSRLYGIKTLKTAYSGEALRKDAEFEEVILEEEIIKSKKVDDLFELLIKKRLQNTGWISDKDSIQVSSFFESTNSDKEIDELLLSITPKDSVGEEKFTHRKTLKKQLEKLISQKSINSSQADKIYSLFSFPKRPLIEKYCQLAFYKKYKSNLASEDIIDICKEISIAASAIANGQQPNKEHSNRFSQFKDDLIDQIVRESTGRRLLHYGFPEICKISQGIPRNLLTILKSIYRRSNFREEKPFRAGFYISIDSQTEGICDAADWFWQDASPDIVGGEVKEAVERLCGFISDIRFSLNPPECSLSSFSLSGSMNSEHANKIFKQALNWSYIRRIPQGGVDKNKKNLIKEKYQISPMLAPRYSLSTNRRGVIDISGSDLSLIFSGNGHSFIDETKARIRSYNNPLGINNQIEKESATNKKQSDFFGETND